MLKPLPQFHKRSFTYVHRFAARVLTNERQAETTRLVQLVTYPDGHYRAIFKRDYFALPEGQTEPSKSQWNTLKKHMKRVESDVFIFREHGETGCAPGERCFYIDFGFVAPRPR
jgi:hypothetical protein